MSISLDMKVLVAAKYVEPDDEFFTISVARYAGRPIRSPQKFPPSEEFLLYHREHAFLG